MMYGLDSLLNLLIQSLAEVHGFQVLLDVGGFSSTFSVPLGKTCK